MRFAMRRIVVALMGLPGAGKSTAAAALTRRFDLHLLDRDRVRAALFPGCRFSVEEKQAAGQALLAGLRANVALGRDSLVDGMTFARRADVEQFRAAAQDAGADFLPVLFDCPPALAARRVRADANHVAADRDPDLVAAVAARFEPAPADVLTIPVRDEPVERFVASVVAAVYERLQER